MPTPDGESRALLAKAQRDNTSLKRRLSAVEADAQILFEFQAAVREWNREHAGKPGTCWQERADHPPCGLCRAWREYERKKRALDDTRDA